MCKFVLAVAAVDLASPNLALADSFADVVAVTSQLCDRGVPITPATPVLQNTLSWTSEKNWSIGVSAAALARSPTEIVEATAQIARYWSISEDWQLQASAIWYDYPSGRQLRAYDRAEGALGFAYRDLLTFQISTARKTRDTDHRFLSAADLSGRLPLPSNFFMSAGVGRAQAIGGSYAAGRFVAQGLYSYGHLGLGWSDGRWAFEVDRIGNDLSQVPTAASPGAESTSRWTATLSRAF